jgi:hypothetical protein
MFANAYIGAINMIIRGINLINPFSDIGSLPTISLGRIGSGSAVVLQRLRAIRARLTVRLESQYRAYQRSQRLSAAVQAVGAVAVAVAVLVAVVAVLAVATV